ncbi:hypothetical protein Tco_0012786 [Tanacetum coccineum]
MEKRGEAGESEEREERGREWGGEDRVGVGGGEGEMENELEVREISTPPRDQRRISEEEGPRAQTAATPPDSGHPLVRCPTRKPAAADYGEAPAPARQAARHPPAADEARTPREGKKRAERESGGGKEWESGAGEGGGDGKGKKERRGWGKVGGEKGVGEGGEWGERGRGGSGGQGEEEGWRGKRSTYTLIALSHVMSTPAHIDSETISQTDGARSSRVPIPLPDDHYMAVRQAYLATITDSESEPFKDYRETEIPQPLPIASSLVPSSDDPYLIVGQAHTPAAIDTESEPEEAPSETEELQPLAARTSPPSSDHTPTSYPSLMRSLRLLSHRILGSPHHTT